MEKKRKSILSTFRNYFIAGVVVLIPIGITVYLTLFLINIFSKILPKEINPNHYLPYDIPGLEILISIIIIIFIGWLSLSFLGKRLLNIFDNILIEENDGWADFWCLEDEEVVVTLTNGFTTPMCAGDCCDIFGV